MDRFSPCPSQILQEVKAGREEVLATPQPDIVVEVESQSVAEPSGPAPRPGPLLRGSMMLPDQRVVPRVQAREEEELREIRIVDPGALDELELPRDVTLERLKQEADFPGRGRASGSFTRRCSPEAVRDAATHDPMAALLFPIQERVGPSLVRLPDVRVERTTVPDAVMCEVLEVVYRAQAVPRSKGDRRPILEPADDEGTGQRLVRRETRGEVFHARVEVRDILLELSEDEVASECIRFARERIVDQDQSERCGRIPSINARLFLCVDVRSQEEGLAPRVNVPEVFDRIPSRVPQDGAPFDGEDVCDLPKAFGHLARFRCKVLGGIMGQAHEGVVISLIGRLPLSRWRIPIPREEREGPKFHPVAEGLPGTAEVLRSRPSARYPVAERPK